MENFLYTISNSILQFTLKDAIDILLVAFLIYELIKLTRKTRAIQVLKGLGLFIVFTAICELFGLTTMSWLLQSLMGVGALLIVVLFQPELRRALEKIGRGKLIGLSFSNTDSSNTDESIEELVAAVLNMSKKKIGALIVFERKTGLRDIMESGTELDAMITKGLIEAVFFPNAPLHDGAMIIRNGRIAAAGCFLPMSDNKNISADLGTRHRSALGISEISDCMVVVVSEETGIITCASEGMLTRNLDLKLLREKLQDALLGKEAKSRIISVKKRKKGAGKNED